MCTLLVNSANKIQMCNKVSFKIQGLADIQKGCLLKIQNKIKCNEKWQKNGRKDIFSSRIFLKLSRIFVVRSKLFVVVSGDGVSACAPG